MWLLHLELQLELELKQSCSRVVAELKLRSFLVDFVLRSFPFRYIRSSLHSRFQVREVGIPVIPGEEQKVGFELFRCPLLIGETSLLQIFSTLWFFPNLLSSAYSGRCFLTFSFSCQEETSHLGAVFASILTRRVR
jgi:hypothetical protein